MARQFDASSFSVAQETRFTWKKAVMSGGIASWSMSMRTVRPRHSTASIRFIFSIQVVPLANQKASSILRAAIWSAFIRPRNTSSTFATKISFGARLMSAGSLATATLSMVRSPTVQQRSCTKARRIGRNRIGSGKLSKNIGSTFFIPRQQRSAHLFAGVIIGSRNAIYHRSACLAQSANQLIQRRGCGITKISEAGVVPWSIPGGKLKQERS